jgi:hypothetical protein
VVLDLLEDPEQADDQIGAVEHDTGEDDADERHLVVADIVPSGPLARGYYLCRALEAVPPGGRAIRDTSQRGREEVVEAEREGGRPHGYEEHLGGGVQELCRGRP